VPTLILGLISAFTATRHRARHPLEAEPPAPSHGQDLPGA